MTEVLLFTQETRGACATQREKNEGLKDEFPDVQFREVDIQQHLDTTEKYAVRKTPTTLVYAGDERVAEFIGIVERGELEDAIETATNQQSGFAQRLINYVRG